MHSSINWALLGLVIERPSYAYELAQRFERTYKDALTLSSASHAYAALGTLKERGLVEELPGTKGSRQPKPHYRATAMGLEEYHRWLIGQVAEERRRQRVFQLQLTALTRDPAQAMKILEDYERACLDETCTTLIAGSEEVPPDDGRDLQARLIAEEKRLAVGAKIAWAHYARRELKALGAARAARTDQTQP
ncbi:MAG TPA: PadR family transcriptional regulator [Solirubrobacteraceae bacterium]|jgi:DNA-binding PadR family transcriptional regulator|nr:PadR family transcriptional regulator [Solirubrobacteraceae bacterium]